MIYETTIVGYLGADATIRDLNNGKKVVSFSVCSTKRYTNKNTGEVKEEQRWVRVSAFRDPDKTRVAELLKKGTLVYVRGEAKAYSYVNNNGETVPGIELTAFELKILTKKDGNDLR